MSYKIGVVGLGVMGSNLALNMERNGFAVAGYDLDAAKRKAFIEGPAAGKQATVVDSPDALMAVLEKPRRILIMVPAGPAVDSCIDHLKPHLEAGDILIDGGNSHFLDTERRSKSLAEAGFHFVGSGVSGGEEGALWGPAIMPGGPDAAWEALAPILQAIAAKTSDGLPCVTHIGPRGAGHFVKMVHNGIEYGDMQLIAESYDLLHRGAGLGNDELADIFAEWNAGELSSYLIEITAAILRKRVVDGSSLVDAILDEAQQKGTGKWASQSAFDLGAATPTINSAVESRILSGLQKERVHASKILRGPDPHFSGDKKQLVADVRAALYASKICSYAQGFALMNAASKEFDYSLKMGEIASIWRAGCIIRATLLTDITAAFARTPELANLLLDDAFREAVDARQTGWRRAVTTAINLGLPMLATSASLAYFDAYRSRRLPANLTQAQRDCFGAHTYRRLDREGVFHSDWLHA